jgi:hypothetical protein
VEFHVSVSCGSEKIEEKNILVQPQAISILWSDQRAKFKKKTMHNVVSLSFNFEF